MPDPQTIPAERITRQYQGVWPEGRYTRYIVDYQVFRVLQQVLHVRYRVLH
jgi:hypothetical protein